MPRTSNASSQSFIIITLCDTLFALRKLRHDEFGDLPKVTQLLMGTYLVAPYCIFKEVSIFVSVHPNLVSKLWRKSIANPWNNHPRLPHGILIYFYLAPSPLGHNKCVGLEEVAWLWVLPHFPWSKAREDFLGRICSQWGPEWRKVWAEGDEAETGCIMLAE